MWDKLKAWCFHSLTVAWTYVQIAASAALLAAPYVLDRLNDVAGDPVLLSILAAMLPTSAQAAFSMAIGAVTLLCRLRSIYLSRE